MANLLNLLIADPFEGVTSYAEWLEIAREDDERTGKAAWRKTDKTALYDYGSIRQRWNTLRQLRKQGLDRELLFTLNEGLHGNMDGMANPSLYRRAKSGTKVLIGNYVDEVVRSLEYLADPKRRTISHEDKLDFFDRAAHCYGSTALMLSGAGALGFFHLGVAIELHAQGLLPSVISGSSAGSLVAGIIGTRTQRELDELMQLDILQRTLTEFDQIIGPVDWKHQRRLTADAVVRQIELWVPDLTFQEAYELSGRHINITVSATRRHQKSRLLNAITSPNVLLRPAIAASCAVPGIYPPVRLKARDASGRVKDYLPKERWVDGSLASDLPARRLSRLYGVNHYIASQVNPFVLWSVIELRNRDGIVPNMLDFGLRLQKEWLRYLRSSSTRLLGKFPEAGYLVDSVFSVASQEYAGDINIVPRFRFFDPRKLLSHLTEGDRDYLIQEGRRATWPKIEMVRNSSKIGLTLNRILAALGHDSVQLSAKDTLPSGKPRAARSAA